MAEAAVTGSIAGSKYVDDRSEIVDLFRTLRDQRTSVSIQLDQTPTNLTARVLDVDARAYLLDDIRPLTGNSEMLEGRSFSLTGRTPSRYLFVTDNRIDARKSERGVPYFEVPLPGKVLCQNRRHKGGVRQSLRIRVNGARLHLYRETGAVAGRIVDLSAGGCRVELDPAIQPGLAIGEAIPNCEIVIPNVMEVFAKAAVRHFNLNKTRTRMACGIEFTEMHVTERRRLERFIQTIAKGAGAA